MSRYLESVSNVVLDRSPQEWIVGLVIALFLALALAGVHVALRRWAKVQDETAPLVGTAVVAIFAGMVIAGIYVQLERRANSGTTGAGAAPGGPGGFPGGGPGGRGGGGGGGGRLATNLANMIFDNADADHDGMVTTEEAANAAAKFVHDSAGDGKDKLDRETLVNILRERMRPPGTGSGGNPAPPRGESPKAGGTPSPDPAKRAPAP
jgi:hypothetical protein